MQEKNARQLKSGKTQIQDNCAVNVNITTSKNSIMVYTAQQI